MTSILQHGAPINSHRQSTCALNGIFDPRTAAQSAGCDAGAPSWPVCSWACPAESAERVEELSAVARFLKDGPCCVEAVPWRLPACFSSTCRPRFFFTRCMAKAHKRMVQQLPESDAVDLVLSTHRCERCAFKGREKARLLAEVLPPHHRGKG